MSDLAPITAEELQLLRRRLDQLAPPVSTLPASPPPPNPESWAGQIAAAQEKRRQERAEAAMALAAAYNAELQRRQERADALRAEIKALLERKERAEDEWTAATAAARAEFERRTRPHDAQLESISTEIDARVATIKAEIGRLEEPPVMSEVAAPEDDGRTSLKDRLLGRVRRSKVDA